MPRCKKFKLEKMSKRRKKALAKAMRRDGYSLRQIEDYVGADHSTLARWAKDDDKISEKETRQAQEFFNKVIGEHDRKVLSLAYQRLEEMLPKETRISELIKAAEFAKGNAPQQQTNVQVNFGQLEQIQRAKYGEL